MPEQIQQRVSRIATTDLSTSQYRFVALDANSQIVLAGAGVNVLGVLQDKPIAGRVGAVCIFGRTSVVYGGTVAAGDPVSSDATGRAVTTVGATTKIVGKALAAGVVGDVGDVLLEAGSGVL
jgi:hypothetical protein